MRSRHARLFCLGLVMTMLVAFLPSLAGGLSAAPVVTVGAPINVSAATGNQAEATIAVDPNNPQRIFVASNPGTTAASSLDGGATWTRFSIPNTCCDNVAVFDQFSNLFLININSGLNRIDLYLSTTGGTSGSFSLLQTLDTGGVDQPTVAVGAGSVWATWNKSGTIYARGAAVTGLGAANIGAFNALQAAPNSNTVGGQFGDIAIGPTGQVTVTYQSDTRIYVNTDADGLGTGGFGAQVNVTATNVDKFDYIPAQAARSIDAEVGLVYDTSGGPNNGRLYMVYTDETVNENNDTEILVRISNDNGATWGAAKRVNDDATTRSQFLPHIALDRTTGYIAVTWHDARNDSGAGAGTTNGTANDDAQFWGTFSVDGGANYLPNFAISDGTSNASVAASGVDYGDYRWSAFVNGSLYPVWADNSNSTGDNPNGALSRFDSYIARVTLTNILDPTTTVAAGSATYSDASATLTATVTVTAGGAPVPAGGAVTFTFNGNNYSATTNASGVATTTAPLPPGTNAGTYPGAVVATFAGDAANATSTGTGPLVVAKAATALTQVRGEVTYGETNGLVTATLRRTNGDGGPVVGAMLSFTVNGAAACGVAGKPTCPTTNAQGVAELTGVAFAAGSNAGSYPNVVAASFAGDVNHLASAGSGPLRVNRRILWVKPTDRTVGFQQPNPPATPPTDCLAGQTPTSACWLELINGSAFVNGDDWGDLGIFRTTGGLRFVYARSYPGSNTTEYVGKTYRISASGLTSVNYDIRYATGTLTVVP